MNRLLKLMIDNRAAPRLLEARSDPNVDQADLMIYGVIAADVEEAEWFGGVAPEHVVATLADLQGRPLRVRINSPGGSVFGGRAIEQALREHDAPVTVQVDGIAASAATVAAMGAGKIVLAPGAMWMIHKAWSLAVGNANDMLETAALLEKIDGTLAESYARRTGRPLSQIGEWMARETWFTAAEAIDAGFADEVLDEQPRAKVGADAWNLSAYANAPRLESARQEQRRQESQRRAAALLRPLEATLANVRSTSPSRRDGNN